VASGPGLRLSDHRSVFGDRLPVLRRLATWCVVGLLIGCEPQSPYPDHVVGVFGRMGLRAGEFSYPRAVAADRDGTMLIVDKAGRVQRFDRDGAFVNEWRMPDTAAGKPVGLAVHPDGRVFAADTHYSRVTVFDADGTLIDTFGRHGTGDGEFLLPTDVAFAADGTIFVSEYQGNDRITKWSPAFEFLGVIAAEPIDGVRLSRPSGIEIDDEQTLWIADSCNHRIVRLTLEGEPLAVFGGFGRAPGRMRYPYDLAITPEGDVLVCEYEGNRLQWFSTSGEALRVWGEAGRRVGTLHAPWGVACAGDGRIFVVDSENYRVQIIDL